jgi:hypothetical protein
MGYVEFIEIEQDGVTIKGISEISVRDEVETFMGISSGSFKLACVVCFAPVEGGLGHSYCNKHTPSNYKSQTE